jgi:hypothetical protein
LRCSDLYKPLGGKNKVVFNKLSTLRILSTNAFVTKGRKDSTSTPRRVGTVWYFVG